MKPWRHYVPVSPDLSDLKAKFDWAQSHPKKAFQIARNGSELMRYLTSPKGMEERYQKDILGPLRAVIDAYIPLSQMSEYKDKSWKEALTELEGEGNVLPILKCTGESSKSCETIVGKEAFLDRNVLRRVTNAGEFEAKKTDSPQVNNRQLAPWAHQFFADVNKKPDTSRETAMFWHIPKVSIVLLLLEVHSTMLIISFVDDVYRVEAPQSKICIIVQDKHWHTEVVWTLSLVTIAKMNLLHSSRKRIRESL